MLLFFIKWQIIMVCVQQIRWRCSLGFRCMQIQKTHIDTTVGETNFITFIKVWAVVNTAVKLFNSLLLSAVRIKSGAFILSSSLHVSIFYNNCGNLQRLKIPSQWITVYFQWITCCKSTSFKPGLLFCFYFPLSMGSCSWTDLPHSYIYFSGNGGWYENCNAF